MSWVYDPDAASNQRGKGSSHQQYNQQEGNFNNQDRLHSNHPNAIDVYNQEHFYDYSAGSVENNSQQRNFGFQSGGSNQPHFFNNPATQRGQNFKKSSSTAQPNFEQNYYQEEGYTTNGQNHGEDVNDSTYVAQMEALRSRERRGRRSRSRSRSRGRRKSRSRSSSRERRNHRGRSRSRSRNRRRSRSRSRSMEDERGVPTNVSKLHLLNMPSDVDRNMIAMVMASAGFLPQDIRVVHRGFERGAPRSFGFIDFADSLTAKRWMDFSKGWLTLADGRRIEVQYAKEEPTYQKPKKFAQDWCCSNCSAQNFFKREVCYKCETSKGHSMEMERQGVHMVGVVPCDTLLIRTLPSGATTASIFESLSRNTSLANIVQIQLSESKSYAYIQMKTVEDATLVFNSSYKSPLKVFNADVILTYARYPLNQIMNQQCDNSRPTDSGHSKGSGAPSNMTGAEVAHAAMMRQRQGSAHMPAAGHMHPAAASFPAMMGPGGMYNMPPPNMPFNVNVPPPMMAVNPHVPDHSQTKGIIGISPTPRGVMSKYVAPNPAMFVLEPSTGYFLDPVTNFYYDAKTSYYYNNETREWTEWDATYQTYFPVQSSDNTAATTTAATEPVQQKKNEPKSAADVAKEMAKWAKKQEKNKLQFTMKPLVKPLETKSAFEHSSSIQTTGDEPRNVSDDRRRTSDKHEEREDEDPNIESHHEKVPSPVRVAAVEKKSCGSPVRPSAQEQREMMERSLIDEPKKMCLLCKRAFPSVDVLRKHVEKSDLHKKNLEEKRIEWGKQYMDSLSSSQHEIHDVTPQTSSSNKTVYRDRAKERRQQYGIDDGYAARHDTVLDPKLTEERSRKEFELAANRPIDTSSNIGGKLLKGMGWVEGQGVGKHGQGIVNPIEADRRVVGAGLGSSGSKITHSTEASHKERVRASFYNRYHELQ